MALPLTDIGPLRTLLERPPLCIASDIDGTLAPIASRPEDARVSPLALKLLRELLGRGVQVVLATGRPLAVARAMAPLAGAAYAANHGLSLWVEGREETSAEVLAYVEPATRAVSDLRRLKVPGIVIEEKGPVVAVHYRQAAAEAEARSAILEAIAASEAAKAFRLHEGRKVIELRPPLAVDKGTALEALAERLGAHALLCLGDDTTDIDMFRAAERLRQHGMAAATVAVSSEEASPELLAGADYRVEGVAGVEWLLGEVKKALPARQP